MGTLNIKEETKTKLDFSKNVPRYTSYPTANHFTPDVQEQTVSRWLDRYQKLVEVTNDATSLYIHIPYCRQICWYCGCNTKAVKKEEVLYDYVATLIKEIKIVSEHLNDQPIAINHIHFGGGSPTILPASKFTEIMNAIKSNFNVLDDADIAIEIDPREISEVKVAAYARAGVNRASIGVQDFDIKVQRAINRIQPFRVVHYCVSLLKSYDIHNINLDLIYGLPYQTNDIIIENVKSALLLKPSRISLFGYAHVPWMKSHMKMIDEDTLPNSDLRLTLFETAKTMLLDAGYKAIGLDHFVLPYDPMALAREKGELHRNFQGYTTDSAPGLIGFGVSAISSLPNGYHQNATDIRGYTRAVDAGTLPIVKGAELTDEDLMRRDIINRLMCDYKADIHAIVRGYGYQMVDIADSIEQLSAYEDAGLIHWEDNMLVVNDEARQVVRFIAAAFDAYLSQSPNKHAQAA